MLLVVKEFFVPARQGIAWACDGITIHIRFIVQYCLQVSIAVLRSSSSGQVNRHNAQENQFLNSPVPGGVATSSM